MSIVCVRSANLVSLACWIGVRCRPAWYLFFFVSRGADNDQRKECKRSRRIVGVMQSLSDRDCNEWDIISAAWALIAVGSVGHSFSKFGSAAE